MTKSDIDVALWVLKSRYGIPNWALGAKIPSALLCTFSPLLPPSSPAASYICFTLTTKSKWFDNKYYLLLPHNGSNIQPGKINDVDEIGEKIHPRTPLRYTENGPGGDLLRQIVNRRRSLYAGTSPKRPALLWQEQGPGHKMRSGCTSGWEGVVCGTDILWRPRWVSKESPQMKLALGVVQRHEPNCKKFS